MWSLLEFFPKDFCINILDVGAALSERPPYQSLVDAGRGRIFGFEPDREACEKLNLEYGKPHRFFPFFVGDGRPATFHETNWALTGSLYEPNSRLLEKFQNLAEVVTPIAVHPVDTTRLDDVAEIDDVDFIKIDVQGGDLPFSRMRRVSSPVPCSSKPRLSSSRFTRDSPCSRMWTLFFERTAFSSTR